MKSLWIRTITAWLLAIGLAGAAMAQSEQVLFSCPGGFYEESLELTLDCFYANHHIRSTTNGSNPDATYFLYGEPLMLNAALYSRSNIHTIVNCIPSTYHEVEDVQHAIVIRAAVFDENDSCVSAVATNSYFIRSLGCEFGGLPVVSITADSLSLFDYETGIFIPGINYDPSDSTHTGNYCQRGKEWERLINLEFYENDNTGINQACGLRTHGGASRWFQQKGLRVYAREEYGKKRFKHPFFSTTPIASFKRLNLHPFRCSNWLHTGGQEHLSQMVASQLDVDGLAVRQTVLFINGEYWGIYTLEESPDERYLEDHYDVDPDQVNILKYWGVTENGSGIDWWVFRNWIENADLSRSEDYEYACSRIDIPSFIDYFLLETFGGNLDWPQNNVLQWQAQDGEPFRMIFYDGDGCFTRWYFDALHNATHMEGSSLIINKLLESNTFREMLYNRYIELKSSVFHYHSMKAIWDDYRDLVEAEVPDQSERFGFPKNIDRWQSDMDSTETFFTKRFTAFNEELLELFEYQDNNSNPIVFYPNPNTGSFTLSMEVANCSFIPLEVYDVLGRRVHYEEIFLMAGENQVPMNLPLRSGLYLVRIGNSTQRLIIQ